MPDKEYSFREMKNTDDATASYRRQAAIDAEYTARRLEAELEALNNLRTMAPEHPTEIGGEALNLGNQVNEARPRAEKLRKLSGIKDNEYPYSNFATQVKTLLGQEEEILARAMDQDENPDAYGIDEESARFQMLRHRARCEAYGALLDDFESKTSKGNRASRRSSTSSGVADEKPTATT